MYGRASRDHQIASPDTQKRICEEFMLRLGKKIDGFFLDPATHSKMPMWDRPAGKELMAQLRKDDTLVALRLDRLSRSFIGFAKLLETLENLQVDLYLTDFNGGHFDPKNAMSKLIIHILISFADYQHSLIVQTTKEGIASRRIEGLRYTKNAPLGFKWEARWDSRKGKKVHVAVRDEREWAIAAKCVEMRAAGYSVDGIRQYLNYEWKVPNRYGKHYQPESVYKMIKMYLMHMQQADKYVPPIDDLEDEPEEIPEPEEGENDAG